MRHNYPPPSFKLHNLVNIVYLHENFRQYSWGNAESAHLKIICLWLNVLCQQHFKETSVEVLLDRYNPTPYHYATPKVGHFPRSSVPRHLPPVKCPSWSLPPSLRPTLSCQHFISISRSGIQKSRSLRDTDMQQVLAV